MSRIFTIVLHEPDGGIQTWKFEGGKVTLGTDAACEVVIGGEGVAPRHSSMEFGVDSMRVEDLGSAYGMMVDGERVNGSVEVWYPASVQMGEAVLSVSADRVVSSAGSEALEKRTEGEAALTAWVPELGEGYTLSREVARGGMSRIYEGEDPALKRNVAVKVSRRERGSADERFFKEAEVLAQLAHPNIVPIYSLGRDIGGRPAYSMKLVKGRTLQAILTGLKGGDVEMVEEFSLARLLTVFLKVCDAVAFAHSRGYLHRDLKPENVMVGEFGEVLVMDWGLATRIGEKEEVSSSPGEVVRQEKRALDSTMDGDVVGTPQYMSPEQAAGKGHVLTESSDVYALGAILYSILTLRPPVEGSSLDEVLEKVQKGEITPISRFERPEGGGRNADWKYEGRDVPEALIAVTLKAMELAEVDRYASVEELAADIVSFEGGYATNAENANLLRQLLLLMRRHTFVTVAIGVLLLAGPAFTLKLAASERKARESAQMALRQEKLAHENAELAVQSAREAKESERQALEGKEAARRSEAMVQISLAESLRRDFRGLAMSRALESVPEDLRDDNWRYLANSLDRSLRTISLNSGATLVALAGHPKKVHVFFAVSDDGWVHLLDIQKGTFSNLFRVDGMQGRVWRLAVSNDGEKLAIAVLRDNSVRYVSDQEPTVYRVKDGEKLMTFAFNAPVGKMMFSPDGTMLLVAQLYVAKAQLWDVDLGELRWEMPYRVPSAAHGLFSEDSSRVYLFSANDKLAEIDVRDGTVSQVMFNGVDSSELLLRQPTGTAFFLGERGTVRKRYPEGEKIAFEARPVGRGVFEGGYLTKEGRLLTASERGDGSAVLQVWSARTGVLMASEFLPGRGHLAVHALSGEVIFARGNVVKMWRYDGAKVVREMYASGSVLQSPVPIAFMGDPWRIIRSRGLEVQGVGMCQIEMLDLRDKEADKKPIFKLEPQILRMLAMSPKGNFLAHSGGEGAKTLSVYKREEDVLVLGGSWKLEQKITQLQINPDETKVWTGSGLYELATGNKVAAFSRSDIQSNENGVAAWLGDHKLVETALVYGKKSTANGTSNGPELRRKLLLWDADSGKRLATVDASEWVSMAASPDGKWVMEGGRDQMIRIRSAENLEVVRQFRAHDGEVNAVSWHPILPLLVSVSEDLSVKIWSSETGALVEELRGFDERPDTLFLSPDGLQLGACFKKNWKARLWEPVSFRPEVGKK
ncbi:MAG: protein kinase [Verrucomicrobiota bacterium]